MMERTKMKLRRLNAAKRTPVLLLALIRQRHRAILLLIWQHSWLKLRRLWELTNLIKLRPTELMLLLCQLVICGEGVALDA